MLMIESMTFDVRCQFTEQTREVCSNLKNSLVLFPSQRNTHPNFHTMISLTLVVLILGTGILLLILLALKITINLFLKCSQTHNDNNLLFGTLVSTLYLIHQHFTSKIFTTDTLDMNRI